MGADLHPGSATITLAAETATPAAAAKAEPVVADFDRIGKGLERLRAAFVWLGHSAGTEGGSRPSDVGAYYRVLRLATPSADYVVPGQNGVEPGRALRVSLGTVTGRVQMLTNRGGLRFNLYDQIHDKAGDCYLQSEQTEQKESMRAAWGSAPG